MKSLFYFLLMFLPFLGYCQASVSATATVTVVKHTSITKETDMNFVEVGTRETGSTIGISLDQNQKIETVPVQARNLAIQAASFKIRGEEALYSVSFPKEIVLNEETTTIRISNLTHHRTGALHHGGEDIHLMGTLLINGLLEPGIYQDRRSLQVIVQYK